jgi:hypothetical protein
LAEEEKCKQRAALHLQSRASNSQRQHYLLYCFLEPNGSFDLIDAVIAIIIISRKAQTSTDAHTHAHMRTREHIKDLLTVAPVDPMGLAESAPTGSLKMMRQMMTPPRCMAQPPA